MVLAMTALTWCIACGGSEPRAGEPDADATADDTVVPLDGGGDSNATGDALVETGDSEGETSQDAAETGSDTTGEEDASPDGGTPLDSADTSSDGDPTDPGPPETGALVRVFNLNLPNLTIHGGPDPRTDVIPEFAEIPPQTLSDGPMGGYVEVPLGTVFRAYIAPPQPMAVPLPPDATAGAKYTAIATYQGVRWAREESPSAPEARRMVVITDSAQATIYTDDGAPIGYEVDGQPVALSPFTPILAFELDDGARGFVFRFCQGPTQCRDYHASATRVAAGGAGIWVLGVTTATEGLYLLGEPGQQELIPWDLALRHLSLSHQRTSGTGQTTVTVETPVGPVLVGSASYRAITSSPVYAAQPMSTVTVASALGTETFDFPAQTFTWANGVNVLVVTDVSGGHALVRTNEAPSTGGSVYLLEIWNVTGSAVRYGVPDDGNRVQWSGAIPHGGEVSRTRTASGTTTIQISTNGDETPEATVALTPNAYSRLVYHFIDSQGRHSLLRVDGDFTYVTVAP